MAGIRDEYAGHPLGAPGWYADHGTTYRNPHESAVSAMVERVVGVRPDLFAGGRLLDLCCGSGEVTLALRGCGVDPARIDAGDPFTAEAYLARTGVAAQPWSFRDIGDGCLGDGSATEPRWSVIVCSYALHLCEPSWLPSVAHRLASVADGLVIVTPHKRPILNPDWGWALEDEHVDRAHRVRVRTYRSVVAAP